MLPSPWCFFHTSQRRDFLVLGILWHFELVLGISIVLCIFPLTATFGICVYELSLLPLSVCKLFVTETAPEPPLCCCRDLHVAGTFSKYFLTWILPVTTLLWKSAPSPQPAYISGNVSRFYFRAWRDFACQGVPAVLSRHFSPGDHMSWFVGDSHCLCLWSAHLYE